MGDYLGYILGYSSILGYNGIPQSDCPTLRCTVPNKNNTPITKEAIWRPGASIRRYLPAIVVSRALSLPATVASRCQILGRKFGQSGVTQPKMRRQIGCEKPERRRWSCNKPQKILLPAALFYELQKFQKLAASLATLRTMDVTYTI